MPPMTCLERVQKGPDRSGHRRCGGRDLPKLQWHGGQLPELELQPALCRLPYPDHRPDLASINVVNCTDGVDGLSASLAVVSIGTFLLAYWEELGDYATAGIVFIGALLAYLWQNAKPSTLLMGDAGSRAMGFFLAVLASRAAIPSPFCWPRWCSLWTAAWAS